ncbi:D-lactate dehydrogenase [Xanthomonas sp. JAI131]|uniref:2-hydroxyacid dehydrogenase n=1 Tax=Xanthomonas sp. JAI131 TaxID=2723067 RepID=UPI0015CE06E2|nr:2-hydroxyacid dehydrogenase [Xanthomonas sp. JAI131]NYF20247.1 D-lactate dehydrogenase [Xanthomonas sp. JAI131]
MKVAVYSARRYDMKLLAQANAAHGHDLVFVQDALSAATAPLAAGCGAVCVFVNDRVDDAVLALLATLGVGLVTTRSTGFNHVDALAAQRHGIATARVSDYSPYSVAEFAVGLLIAVNRRIARASQRTRDGNFELDGLMGFDLHGRTVGVVGTGKIGRIFGRIMAGFGCRILGFDPFPHAEFLAQGGTYADLPTLLAQSDVVSLHCPLTPQTQHLIDAAALQRIKLGALLVNTSRGGLVDTEAVIAALKSARLSGLAIDVYEQEADLFFHDLSATVITDDVIQRLVSFPNVIVTGHQAFFTEEAIGQIMAATLDNISAFERGAPVPNPIPLPLPPGAASGGA